MTDFQESPHKHEFGWWISEKPDEKGYRKHITCKICKKSISDVIYEIQQITGAFS